MITLDEAMSSAAVKRRDVDIKLGERKVVANRISELQSEIAELTELTQILDKVTVLLNAIGEDKQQEAQEKIEGIITRGLHSIFGDTFSFHIVQTVNGKTASVEFFIRTMMGDSVVETPVLESHGGGLAAVVGFLLRVTVMLLDKGEFNSRVLILDETFGMVSDEYLAPLGEFIRELIDKTGMQVILVTHQPEWIDYADKTYRFGIRNGETFVREE
jgi:DNA repair exonuclease SbcCD ATPase subunit